ncbi:amidohydrolase family protein [Chelativorans salis]|uniref:Amidohydrolase family protein n=1 Tax=Chelativorans salis TaxID=2978478 RepID=A0ABT2LRR1_9HYPH|nr:amidohydrolase family protein [Chelativorans sp. EGI FJ00035]MCT7377230.1 amidohydrolase family protein [Chelativorans sp. EGI FJ00035]
MQKAIDAHFHIWRQEDLPWLAGPMVPRIFGPYEPIRRDYTIGEFLDDQKDSGIEKAVYVQTNWAREHFEEEAAWVQATAEETGWPHAIVGYADMTVDDIRPQLDRLKRYSLVRGVRMQLHWHETPEYRFAPSPHQVVDPALRANIARLKDYGFSFDLQLFPGQMRDGAALVAENPQTQFILTHTGMLTDMRPETIAEWEAGLRMLAAHPNVSAKLSGLGTFIHRNAPELISFVVTRSMDIFGSRRLMFGSNFPIEKLWTDHLSMMNAYRDAAASYSAEDQANIFWNTAERVYRPV